MCSTVGGYKEVAHMNVKGVQGLAALGVFLCEIPTEFAVLTGMEYVGHSLTQTGGGWLLVMRAKRGAEPLVSFSGGRSHLAAYRNMYMGLKHKTIKWKKDRLRQNLSK